MEPLLTPKEVCEMLQLKLPALRELCRTRTLLRSPRPTLPFIKLHKKALRFRRSDIELWLNQLAQAQAASAGR
jgi:predicted DNA-binding transcriptional regulator AlpA